MGELGDIEGYLARIGHAGPREPSVATLRALHLAHTIAIPFENLDARLGRAVPLDLAAIERKLVRDRRGGWCFEQNLLFGAVLRALGFEVTGLAARVLWDRPDGPLPPRSHMLLRVIAEGTAYVADVGFGGQTLSGPLLLQPGVRQETPHEPFRLVEAGTGLDMQSLVEGTWRSLYRFDFNEQLAQDYEHANYYLATHPESHFRGVVMAARNDPDRRYGLLNHRLSVHVPGGPTERQTISEPAAIRETLETVFRIRLPDWPELETMFAETAAGAPAPGEALSG